MAAGGNGERANRRATAAARRRPVFRGVSELVLDAKGRVAIPARHREDLAGRRRPGGHHRRPGGCLLSIPLAAWEPIQARADGACRRSTTAIRSVQRLLVGHADDVELDAAGRILVPPALRRYAGLDKRVVLVGQGQKLELWDEVKWQAQIAQTITFRRRPAARPRRA